MRHRLPPGTRLFAQITVARHGTAALMSHLEFARALHRAVRRADLPIAYSKGFSPRPRMSFASPLPVGVTSDGELVAMELLRSVPSLELARALRPQLPDGFELVELQVIARRKKALFEGVDGAEYVVDVGCRAAGGAEGLRERAESGIRALLDQRRTEIVRTTKKGERTVDIRPFVDALELCECDSDGFSVRMRVGIAPEAMAKPAEVIEALAASLGEVEVLHIHRVGLLARRRGES
ncbi:MAG: TIGR03936 family radical SAM-associated protein [Armatimonadota bacterium]|jgi:radical SAM-linked protein